MENIEQNNQLSITEHVDHVGFTEINRLRIAELFSVTDERILIVPGSCSMTEDMDIIAEEAMKIRLLDFFTEGLVALHRLPPWKPRTNPKDWFGLITSNPEMANKIMQFKAVFFGDFASEIGLEEHLKMFQNILALGWIGSRNFEKSDIGELALRREPFMPLGVKNDMNGNTDSMMDRIEILRRKFPLSTIIPIFRGGTLLDDQKKWEESFKRLSDQTNGLFIVDSAHGTEMAHDITGNFSKSVEAQIEALHHIKELRIAGHICKGLMVETSNIKSRTDPNIPFEIGMAVINEILNTSKAIRRHI